MKIRILSGALRGRFGDTMDSDDLAPGILKKWLDRGQAVELKPKKKKTTESKAKKKAENTSASD